ncbi:MAG: radical SAM protein [Dehalococcoidales bacterium]|nr:radical SAM protein [Dehalococcoidales bacterium]
MIVSVVYGPVPSRRLGYSLGINNIPPKICSYSCVYCQLGSTLKRQLRRESFYSPERIAQQVTENVNRLRGKGQPIDYLTLVSDGEPTLDSNLGREIELLKPLRSKIAVITNASLLWRDDVRQDLQKADWVSLKVDAVTEEIWQHIDRPHRSLKLEAIQEGMLRFADSFKGCLTTETMLISGVNDSRQEMERVSDFLARLEPAQAYLAIPTRPPAVEEIAAATESTLNQAYQIFSNRLSRVEYLIGDEGNAFATSGRADDDLLSITAVHPMREAAVKELLNKNGVGWGVVTRLIQDGRLIELEYQGNRFYTRRLPRDNRVMEKRG